MVDLKEVADQMLRLEVRVRAGWPKGLGVTLAVEAVVAMIQSAAVIVLRLHLAVAERSSKAEDTRRQKR